MLGASYWREGYGASISPPISNDSNYCYLVFYYKLWKKGRANLTISIEESNENKWTILWSSNDTVDYWKKEVITLPQTSFNYSIVFFGFFQSHGHVAIDDMDLIQCGLCKLLHIFSWLLKIFCPRAISLNAHVTKHPLAKNGWYPWVSLKRYSPIFKLYFRYDKSSSQI